MPLPPYVERRRRKLYARLRIPKDIQEHYEGKTRLLQSLGTDNVREAEHLALLRVAQWKREFEKARLQKAGGWQNDPLQAEAKKWLAAIREAPDEEAEDQLKSMLDDRVDELAFQRSKELGVNPSSFERDNPDADKYDLPGYADESVRTFAQVATGKRISLLEHLDDYLEAPTTQMTDKSMDQVRADVQRLARTVPWLREINRRAIQGWVEKLLSDEKLAKSTIQRTLSSCRNYWRYLQRREIVPDDLANPFSEIDLGSNKGHGNGKGLIRGERPFEAADVVRLLNAAIERDDRKLANLIRIAMWTGCRREELCALTTDKVMLDASLPYFEVEGAKTAAGRRQVPIHSRLLPFMEQLIETSEDGYVLSGLTAANKYTRRGDAIGKRFGHLKRKLGFDERYVFHSIRKTVVTLLDNAEVPVAVISELVGHEIPTFTQKIYSAGATLERKKDAIEKLAYP